ncbi:ATP-binding cassette domain-containing protein [Sphingomonas changnyeongensis]|uniref:ATP-binding cassette domain-containing protein n=1 Tax=Sphingomonas changnyeongensis TaxID=2698679 RepID=A0A7Z2S7W9_9SPHN|nr:ATP-binding cassette domain-containing protein [Sphingomonas changnyeongensis]QHL90766.1 ATP-binding cassette domain-containing protein [Sphingomonas changnyeongensis]
MTGPAATPLPAGPAEPPPILSARGLGRVLPGDPPVALVTGVDLDIRPGRFVTVIGPSGCGKSSLLYLLGLLDRPTMGTLTLDGADTGGMSGDARARARLRRFGFVFQFHFLLGEFSALDNVLLPIRRLGALAPAAARARAMALLEMMGLADQAAKTPDRMSGGQRQRVAIARALANDPALVLGDEPTGNLDSQNSARVVEILRALAHDEGRAVVCVTHDGDIAAAADTRIHMRDGRIERID